MTIETMQNVTQSPGTTAGLNTKAPAAPNASALPEAFTVTLNQQFQLLTAPLSSQTVQAPSTMRAITVNNLNATGQIPPAIDPTAIQSNLTASFMVQAKDLLGQADTQPHLAEQSTLQNAALQIVETAPDQLTALHQLNGLLKQTLSALQQQNAPINQPNTATILSVQSQSPALQPLVTLINQPNTTQEPPEVVIQNQALTLQELTTPSSQTNATQETPQLIAQNQTLPLQQLATTLKQLTTLPISPVQVSPQSQAPVLQQLDSLLTQVNTAPAIPEATTQSETSALQQLTTRLKQPSASTGLSDMVLQADSLQEISELLDQYVSLVQVSGEVPTTEAAAQTLANSPDLANQSIPSTSLTVTLPQVTGTNRPQSPNTTEEATETDLLQAGLLQPFITLPPDPTTAKPVVLPETPNTPTANASLSTRQASDQTIITTDTVNQSAPNDAKILGNTLISAPKNQMIPTLEALNTSEPKPALPNDFTQALAGMTAQPDRPTTTAKVDLPAMNAHLYSPDWNKELGTKITWMTNQHIASAELKLNPAHLGPISIHIDMQDDQANIAFTANNAGVKEMLEASLPKLREMLQTQQLNLAEVTVAQQSFSGQGQPQSPFSGQTGDGQKRPGAGLEQDTEQHAITNETAEQIEEGRTLVTNGLVSLYA